MPDLTLWDRLATIDPALTASQKCEHDWRRSSDRAKVFECSKCPAEAIPWKDQPLPAFGHGDNAARYNKYSALDDLRRRLGLKIESAQGLDPCLALATAILKAMGGGGVSNLIDVVVAVDYTGYARILTVPDDARGMFDPHSSDFDDNNVDSWPSVMSPGLYRVVLEQWHEGSGEDVDLGFHVRLHQKIWEVSADER